jgi:cytochrome c-type biogenesis protein
LNEKIEPFELTDLDGNLIESSDFQGKVLVLDFWSTWCGVCRTAFLEFQKVYRKYKHHPEVAFLAVNTSRGDDSPERVKRFVEINSYEFPVAYDEDS